MSLLKKVENIIGWSFQAQSFISRPDCTGSYQDFAIKDSTPILH